MKFLARCKVPDVVNGQVRRHLPGEMVVHEERIEIQCNERYEVDFPNYPMCSNGSWTYIPRCVPIRCKIWPPAVKNGMVIFTKSDHNAAARYTCDPGFELKGNPIVRCMYGEWVGLAPTCEESNQGSFVINLFCYNFRANFGI